MNYALHPEAALEHEKQVAYYEERQANLGNRYHSAFRVAVAAACEAPQRFKVVRQPSIRKVGLRGFRFSVIYREIDDVVQILAVAHHRRRPDYWASRL